MKLKATIPNPCSENWNQMKIGVRSRFCDNCQKNVMDFTSINRHEILEYLLMNRNSRVCGRILPNQLDFSYSDIQIIIQGIPKKHQHSNLSFYILAMSTLMLLSCDEPPTTTKNNQKTELQGQKCETPNQIKEKNIDEPDFSSVTLGEPIFYEENNLTGDIVYTEEVEEQVYSYPTIMPEYQGGVDSLYAFIHANLKYPEWELKNKIEGTVIVKFIIDQNGAIIDPTILKSVEKSKNFNSEVLRIISEMPNWIPGKNNNQNVTTEFRLPISFKI